MQALEPKSITMRSLILITLAAGAAAQTTPLTCPTAEIPPASVHKSTARFRSMAVWVSRRLKLKSHWLILYAGSTPKNHARYL